MAPHAARKDAAALSPGSPPAAACGCAPTIPGAATPLDPLIFALSRAVDRLGPGQVPDPRPDTAG